jgi:sigma-E factor negative regulatory protein RseC
MSEELVSHRGIITEIEPDVIRVCITAESACAACHAKGFCTIADQKEKVIEVRNRKPNNYKIGDSVQVTMKKVTGLKAVLYGYFLPFIILMITLLIIFEITKDQAIAGLSALFILIPYYFALYMLREKLKSDFEFELRS